MPINRHSRTVVFRVVASLLGISCLLWILFGLLYVTFQNTAEIGEFPESRSFVSELRRSRVSFAESSGSAQPTSAPTLIPTTVPTRAPTSVPSVIVPSAQTATPAQSPKPQGQAYTPAPQSTTSVRVPTSGVVSSSTVGPKPTNKVFPFLSPTPSFVKVFLPTPTPQPQYPRLAFALAFPDIAPSVRVIGELRDTVTVVLFREDNFGRLIKLPETATSIVMDRVGDSPYFETREAFLVKIAPFFTQGKKPLKKEIKKYALFVKAGSTIGRLFQGIALKAETPARTLECGIRARATNDCGELSLRAWLRGGKPIFSGDSDGFSSSSFSYNVVDLLDLDYVASAYHKKATMKDSRSADFNQDGRIDELDIDIVKNNYGVRGDAVPE